MDHIYNLISDGVLLNELIILLRNRNFEQKFFYLKKGVDNYYNTRKKDAIYKKNDFNVGEVLDIWKKTGFDKKDKIGFISLGCGDANIDKHIFQNMDDGSKIDYFGVDSSKEMLEYAIKNLKNVNNVKKTFICADFSANNFRSEMIQLTSSCDKRIFAFFSNTFGNINHTNIIDILYNLLNKGEKIWLDVRLRSGLSASDDLEIFDYYASWLNLKQEVEFYEYPLANIGIPPKNGKLIVSSEKEKGLNALKFNFKFLFTKKTEIVVKSEHIVFLPEEELSLMSVYAYDKDSLISFFKEHNFKLIEKNIKHSRGMFLFEKM